MRSGNTRVTICVRRTHSPQHHHGTTHWNTNIMQNGMHCCIYGYSVLCELQKQRYFNGIQGSKHGSMGITNSTRCYKPRETLDLPRTWFCEPPCQQNPALSSCRAHSCAGLCCIGSGTAINICCVKYLLHSSILPVASRPLYGPRPTVPLDKADNTQLSGPPNDHALRTNKSECH